MYLYKYQSVSALSLMMLKNGNIYFASSSELNDRNECRSTYIFNGSKRVWLRFLDYVLCKICYKYHLFNSLNDADKLISLSTLIYEKGFECVKKRNFNIEDIIAHFNIGFDAVLKSEFTDKEKQKIKYYSKQFLLNLAHTEMLDDKYITSFSKSATNPTMWGHYASAETGFTIIYESKDGYIDVQSSLSNLSGGRKKENGMHEYGFYKHEKLLLRDVIYSKSPCKVNGFSKLIHKFRYSEQEAHYDEAQTLYCEIKKMEEANIGLIKYTDWKYEQEIRILFPNIGYVPSEHRCLQISGHQIKGIIFGVKTTEASKEKIIMACSHLLAVSNIDLAIFQAGDSIDKYLLNIVPVGMIKEYFPLRHTLPIKKYEDLTNEEKKHLDTVSEHIVSKS